MCIYHIYIFMQSLKGLVAVDDDEHDPTDPLKLQQPSKHLNKEELKVKELMNITAESTEQYKEKLQFKEEGKVQVVR